MSEQQDRSKRDQISALKPTTLTGAARSDLWFYPGEELVEGEMRVTLMGTGWGNVVTPTQKGPSVFVELGNEAKSSFVFDVGPGCILNYNAMEIPMSRMDHVFLSHLHMDHCSDLPFIYAFGPNLGDRYKPLNIYGPSGPQWPPEGYQPDHGDSGQTGIDHRAESTILGTKNLVEGMKKFTQWHTTSFSTMSSGAARSYQLKDEGDDVADENPVSENVYEFDYRISGGVVFENDTPELGQIRITSFPAVHIIDGAVSYRLEWTPHGKSKAIVFVYSGDTLPNEFMIENGQNADLLIHETAPSVNSVMNGANVSEEKANDIVSNSHTPAEFLGYVFSLTNPRLGITTHTPMDPRSVDAMITDVRINWQGPYQIGADFMVFNTNGTGTPTTRMGVPVDRAWPVRIQQTPDLPPPLGTQADIDYLRSAKAIEDDQSELTTIFEHEIEKIPYQPEKK